MHNLFTFHIEWVFSGDVNLRLLFAHSTRSLIVDQGRDMVAGPSQNENQRFIPRERSLSGSEWNTVCSDETSWTFEAREMVSLNRIIFCAITMLRIVGSHSCDIFTSFFALEILFIFSCGWNSQVVALNANEVKVNFSLCANEYSLANIRQVQNIISSFRSLTTQRKTSHFSFINLIEGSAHDKYQFVHVASARSRTLSPMPIAHTWTWIGNFQQRRISLPHQCVIFSNNFFSYLDRKRSETI